MRGRPVNVVYDAVIRRPKQVSDRQGGDKTACRAHDGITSLGLTDVALPAVWESMRAATCVGRVTEAWMLLLIAVQNRRHFGWRRGVEDVEDVVYQACTKHYCSLPKEPQPHITLVARSARLDGQI
jgi:hypothetical protein